MTAASAAYLNMAVELTASSVRCAPASGSSSPQALDALLNHCGEKEGDVVSYEGPQFYDNEAVFQTYMQHHQRPDNPNDTLEKPIILALLGSVRGAHLLDLGCGDAALGKTLLEQGAASYLGLDGSRNMVERAQQTLAGTIGRVMQADIRSWTYPPNTCDLVLSRLARCNHVGQVFSRSP